MYSVKDYISGRKGQASRPVNTAPLCEHDSAHPDDGPRHIRSNRAQYRLANSKESTRPGGSKNYRLDLHGVELNVTQFLEEQKLEQFMGLAHVAIDTNNFDGEIAKIKSAGIKILEERVLPDGRRVCFFQGPEGVRLEFLEWK